jgi:sugar phosphate isomerase/epimerase
MIGLSTSVRPRRAHAEAVASLLDSLSPDFVALDAEIPPALWHPLVARLLADADERPIRVVYAPGPRPDLAPRKRLPQLASPDREEVRAAAALVVDTVARAADLGARIVVLPTLGRVPLPQRGPRLIEWLERGYLDTGGPAVEKLARYRAERQQVVPPVLDGVRQGLDRIGREAERRGLLIGVPNAARYDELPTRDELLRLLHELEGAPVGLWLDTYAAHAKEVWGLGSAAAFLQGVEASRPAVRIIGATLTDAAGLLGGLAPGRGEIDFDALLARLPEDAWGVVACEPWMREEEVAGALERLALAARGAREAGRSRSDRTGS